MRALTYSGEGSAAAGLAGGGWGIAVTMAAGEGCVGSWTASPWSPLTEGRRGKRKIMIGC